MRKLKSLDLIKNLNNELFEEFINQIINNYLSPEKNEDFNYLISTNSNSESIDLSQVSKEWSIYIAKFYDLEKNELPIIDDLDENKKENLIKIMKHKNQLIKRFLFNMAINKDCSNLLNEFDWNINLVLATDQICNLNKLLINLQFNNSNNDKICHLELNEDELDQFIEAVDNISNELKSLLA